MTATRSDGAPGLVLAQLGTPAAPTPRAVRRYLAEFLSDRRVVDLPRWRWWPVLHGIVLRVRPRRSAALYRRIWTGRGSPLRVHTEDLARRLAAERAGPVAVGMRYGGPTIATALDGLVASGAGTLHVLPLFPQYSRTTTGSIEDAVAAWSAGGGRPATVLGDFADHPAYLAALAGSVRAAGVMPTPKAPLLVSFHGIPARYARAGDPYPERCAATAEGLARTLGLEPGAWRIVYQSRFGREPWLGPALDATLAALPAEGILEVAVISPSFFADCLETLDEIGREARHTFLAAGGGRFTRVPCLNADDGALATLRALL